MPSSYFEPRRCHNGNFDTQRHKVYAAEKEALRMGFVPNPLVIDAGLFSTYKVPAWKVKENRAKMVKQAQQACDKILQRKYVQKHYGIHSIRIQGTKAARHAAAATWAMTIELPFNGEWGWRQDVLVHEIAHCLARKKYGCNCHCWQFAEVYLDLVRNVMGKDAYLILKRAYRRHKVRFSKPQTRTLTPEQRDAARERMKLAREAREKKPELLAYLRKRGYASHNPQPLKPVPTDKGLNDMKYTELKELRQKLYEYDRLEDLKPKRSFEEDDRMMRMHYEYAGGLVNQNAFITITGV